MTIKDRDGLTRLIKSALAMRGLTVSDLAVLLGVDRTSCSRSVNRSDLAISDLLRIASALGASLCISFEGGEERATKPQGGRTQEHTPTNLIGE